MVDTAIKLEMLKESRERISDESKWCKDSLAMTELGLRTHLASEAHSWCAMGTVGQSSAKETGRYSLREKAWCPTAKSLLEDLNWMCRNIYKSYHTHSLWMLNNNPRIKHRHILKIFDALILHYQGVPLECVKRIFNE